MDQTAAPTPISEVMARLDRLGDVRLFQHIADAADHKDLQNYARAWLREQRAMRRGDFRAMERHALNREMIYAACALSESATAPRKARATAKTSKSINANLSLDLMPG